MTEKFSADCSALSGRSGCMGGARDGGRLARVLYPRLGERELIEARADDPRRNPHLPAGDYLDQTPDAELKAQHAGPRRTDLLAALFLEKVSPALEHVDRSSGAIGNAVNRASEGLVLVIAIVPADLARRFAWLDHSLRCTINGPLSESRASSK